MHILGIFLHIHHGKSRISAKIASAFETCFRTSAVDRFKFHVVHSECDKVLAYLARLGTVGCVLRWRFALLHSWGMGFLPLMTVILEGGFFGNGIAFSWEVCYNLGVRVGGRPDYM